MKVVVKPVAVQPASAPAIMPKRAVKKRHQIEKVPPWRDLFTRLKVGLSDLGLQVVLDTDLVDQAELRFQPVDVPFLGFENTLEQIPADEILA